MSKSKFLWLAVEADEYELPYAVADTARELATKIGTTTINIINCARMPECNGGKTGKKIVKVRREE